MFHVEHLVNIYLIRLIDEPLLEVASNRYDYINNGVFNKKTEQEKLFQELNVKFQLIKNNKIQNSD